ncbi:MAG: AAA family ATPase [Lachnospiraceae bacterium]|nr:AAA family ATPase [Lachnospiraceae bacterium]
MKRRITNIINDWYTNNTSHLYVTGMRGCGKTTLITDLFSGRDSQEQLYINFETDYEIRAFFEEKTTIDRNMSVSDILADYFHTNVEYFNSAVVIIDEMHVAGISTKMFAAATEEKTVRLIYIDSEGVTIHDHVPNCFSTIRVFPLTFDEFLDNTGKEWYHEVILGHFERMRSVPELVNNEINDIFSDYLQTGGMPAVINGYMDNLQRTGRFFNPEELQLKELRNMIRGMEEYESKDSHKMIGLLEGTISQNILENRHFVFRKLLKGTSITYYADAIEKLCSSGILIKSTFDAHNRFYWSDTGMLSAKIRSSYKCPDDRLNDIIIKNYIALHLISGKCNCLFENSSENYKIGYWCSNSMSEVDFLIEDNGRKIAFKYIGESKKKIRSLQIYDDLIGADEKIAVGNSNFYIMGNVKLIPQYAVFCLNC